MLKRKLKNGPVWALGAMSGTSLDGVDAAILLSDGETISGFGEAAYRPYSDDERALIRAALGRWPGEAGVSQASQCVEDAHAKVLAQFRDIDLVGFHGQTLAHDPGGLGTHQVGDGQILAEFLNLPVVSDFRSADISMGGQGAPLAPFFHFALAKWIGADAPLIFLNLGGVANLTWVDPSLADPEDNGALLAFDTGPANAPLNDFMMARLGQSMDENGALAALGQVDGDVVTTFLEHAYFHKIPPKSLDRDAFAGLGKAVENLSDRDGAATLLACSIGAIVRAIEHCPTKPAKVLVCGGGRHNQTMMTGLKAALNCAVEPVEAVGLNGDMLEAQAFAYLAVRVVRGLPTSTTGTTGVMAAIGGGQIHQPIKQG